METILDTGHSWFLERLGYCDFTLQVCVVEGMASEPKNIHVAGIELGEGRSIDVRSDSRRFTIFFEDVLAYQITNESYTKGDDYEIKTKGALCKYERSRYSDFVRAWTLIDSIRGDKYIHFGLLLEDDVIDVISEAEPRIEQAAFHF